MDCGTWETSLDMSGELLRLVLGAAAYTLFKAAMCSSSNTLVPIRQCLPNSLRTSLPLCFGNIYVFSEAVCSL